MIRYRESLKSYYADAVHHYLDHKIELAKQDAASYIKGVVRNIKIDTPEEFHKAITAHGDRSDDIPRPSKDERRKLHGEFITALGKE